MEQKLCYVYGGNTIMLFMLSYQITIRHSMLTFATSAWKYKKMPWEICFCMITFGYFQQESWRKKILDSGWVVPHHPPYLPDLDFHLFYFATKCSKWQKIFSRRSAENICGKLLELVTSWILLERSQQSTWWMAWGDSK